MNFPFTFYSSSDHRLICVSLDDAYDINRIEFWDELQNCWRYVPSGSSDYNSFLICFKEELDAQEKQKR